jgi:hypothetical protein
VKSPHRREAVNSSFIDAVPVKAGHHFGFALNMGALAVHCGTAPLRKHPAKAAPSGSLSE